LAILEKAQDEFIAVEISKLRGDEGAPQLLFEHESVRVPDTEGDECSDVSQNRLSHGEGDLIEVLVRQSQAESVLASLCQNRRKALRCEVMELVDDQVKVPTLLLRLVSPRHCCKLKLRHQKRAKKVRLFCAEFSLRQVAQENLPPIDDMAETYTGFDLAENVSK